LGEHSVCDDHLVSVLSQLADHPAPELAHATRNQYAHQREYRSRHSGHFLTG
jgi:hypothetical protein